MKLIECYIENFGKLSAYRNTFSDGLNVINGNNGFGKTTLSVFIKSMLYGIDAKKPRGEESDRKRYMPWQGGRFGGSLTFENKGIRYRIERTFGDRPSGDSFAIYDVESGAPSRDFSENVGEELFGIDADGFERTVFLSERKLAVDGSNQTVAAKLSNLVGVDGDMGNFDKALDKLEKMEKHYQHRRGSGGVIGSVRAEIAKLDSDILDLAAKKAECAQAENKLSEISEKANAAAKKKQGLEAKRISEEHEKEYLKKRDALLECEKEISRESEFFRGAPPTREEVRIYEKKKNEALALRHTIDSGARLPEEIPEDYSEELNRHILAIEKKKINNNVNKSCYFYLFFAFLIAVCSVALGATAHYLCYLISLVSLPLIYLCSAALKTNLKVSEESEAELSAAKLFIFEKSGQNLSDDEIYPYLCRMKAELFAKKSEAENARRALAVSEQRIQALTEEYEAFLKKFSLSGEDGFDEIGKRISSYESLTALKSRLHGECERYKAEHNISADIESVSSQRENSLTSEELDAEIKALRGEKFAAEARLSSLYDEISREDELNEKRLELCDRLQSARDTHKTVLKASEHLSAAKESLTSKYLGKMRSSFDSYARQITAEDGASFTIDTNFSLKKTENGLTNKIEGYSLGTRELYSLIARFALIDALYEENPPFIILDDPFCHFDDEKCKSALNATAKIASGKQIIYLTCSDSRTPD